MGVNPKNPVVGAGMDLTPLSRTTTTAVRNAVQPGWRNPGAQVPPPRPVSRYTDVTTVEHRRFAAADRTICLMVYDIDGTRFWTLEEFFAGVRPCASIRLRFFVSNLDAFDLRVERGM